MAPEEAIHPRGKRYFPGTKTNFPARKEMLGKYQAILPAKEEILPREEDKLPREEENYPREEEMLGKYKAILPAREEKQGSEEVLLPVRKVRLPTPEVSHPAGEVRLPRQEGALTSCRSRFPVICRMATTKRSLCFISFRLLYRNACSEDLHHATCSPRVYNRRNRSSVDLQPFDPSSPHPLYMPHLMCDSPSPCGVTSLPHRNP